MANRYLRGTFVRNSWDFYELGAAWAYGGYSAPAATLGFVFRNNGIAQSYIDLYRVHASSGTATDFVWSVLTPSSSYTPIEPDLYFNSPVQLDLASPPGDMAVYMATPPFFTPVIKNSPGGIFTDSIELANGGPFLTLPPMYGISCKFDLTAAAVITMTVWYQSLTDHTPPAM